MLTGLAIGVLLRWRQRRRARAAALVVVEEPYPVDEVAEDAAP